MKKFDLILASGSPRRKELLGWLGIPFEIIVKETPEHSEAQAPEKKAQEIAAQKAHAVWELLKEREGFGESFNPLVVASDTMVCLGEKIYGKPADINEARQMILELKGKTHQVISSVYIGTANQEKTFYQKTQVTFDDVDDYLLEKYLQTKDGLDKAGAYGIQGPSLTFISKIEGSYSNVVGFPLSDFVSELRDFLNLPKEVAWEDVFVFDNSNSKA